MGDEQIAMKIILMQTYELKKVVVLYVGTSTDIL